MTLLKQDDGGYWVSGPLAGVVLTAVFALFIAIYEFQNNKLWEDGTAISELKITVSNDTTEVNKVEASIGAINQTLASVADSLRGLKDASDNLKDQVTELQKQVGDLDLILRPARTLSPGR